MARNQLSFSHNWNGKLFCSCFTTIRLRSDAKYRVNTQYNLVLKGQDGGTVVCSQVKHFKLHELTDFMALIDTGYNKEECTKMITTMYKNIVTDWATQDLSFILLRRVQIDVAAPTPQMVLELNPNEEIAA